VVWEPTVATIDHRRARFTRRSTWRAHGIGAIHPRASMAAVGRPVHVLAEVARLVLSVAISTTNVRLRLS